MWKYFSDVVSEITRTKIRQSLDTRSRDVRTTAGDLGSGIFNDKSVFGRRHERLIKLWNVGAGACFSLFFIDDLNLTFFLTFRCKCVPKKSALNMCIDGGLQIRFIFRALEKKPK